MTSPAAITTVTPPRKAGILALVGALPTAQNSSPLYLAPPNPKPKSDALIVALVVSAGFGCAGPARFFTRVRRVGACDRPFCGCPTRRCCAWARKPRGCRAAGFHSSHLLPPLRLVPNFINLRRQNKITLTQPINLVRPRLNLRFPPGQKNIRMMPLLLCQRAHLIHKIQRGLKIFELK